MIWRYIHCSNPAEHDLQEDLNLVHYWLSVNLLSLNVRKSNVMLVGPCQKLQNDDLNITVDGRPLYISFKYLGLYIDENLGSYYKCTYR